MSEPIHDWVPGSPYTGQSRADAEDALISDPLLKRIHELQAENEKLRAERDYANGCLRASSHNEIQYGAQLDRVCRERDALQSRLDAMTVEWGIQRDEATAQPSREWAERAIQRQRSLKGGFAIKNQCLVSRLVGPWTVVPEGDGNV